MSDILGPIAGVLILLLIPFVMTLIDDLPRRSLPPRPPVKKPLTASQWLAQRADTQHKAYLEGRPEGIYGDYLPVDIIEKRDADTIKVMLCTSSYTALATPDPENLYLVHSPARSASKPATNGESP